MQPARALRPSTPGFDLASAIGGLWLAAGILSDAGYHIRNDVDTFLTPAHALFYSSLIYFGAMTIFLIWTGRRTHTRPWPIGYELYPYGLLLFAVGGVADLAKHLVIGFEEGFDAILSPTHLIIGAGLLMLALGPIRRVLLAPGGLTFATRLAFVLAVAVVMEFMHWVTSYAFIDGAARIYAPLLSAARAEQALDAHIILLVRQGSGIMAILLQAFITAVATLFVVRYVSAGWWRLPLLLFVGNLMVAIAQGHSLAEMIVYASASVLAGFGGELVAALPLPQRWHAARLGLVGFTVPLLYQGLVFAGEAVALGGVWFDLDIAAGITLLCGACGLVLALVIGSGAYPERPRSL